VLFSYVKLEFPIL